VITLLACLREAERHASEQPVAIARDLRLLGWPDLTAQIARYCRNERASAAVCEQLPFFDPSVIDLLWTLADELHSLARSGHEPPLAGISDVLNDIAQEIPLRLAGGNLVAVACLAEDVDRLRDWILQHRHALVVWGQAAAESPSMASLATELRRCLDREGFLLDTASPLLWRLRRSVREREQQVRQSVQRAMAAAIQQGWAASDEVTLRADRFCLPLNATDRRRVSGIVHDRSRTGQTVFVEPAETVQLANDLAESRLEMGAEEARIIMELNQQVDRARPGLLAAAELLLLVDRVRAAGLWSEARQARRPRLEQGALMRICRARHPLLEAALEIGPPGPDANGRPGVGVVPLDLELTPETRALVISGPNAGGKSVALKTVGVLVLLAQCGWDVPAREDTVLPLVRRLFVDLGDEQSIEASLSSFSAHLTQMHRFLQEADEHSLLLCDEIGGGTDPQEGTALALTILDRLASRGALVLASTHYGLLKAAVHDHPAMTNAAMDYDDVSLRPRFSLRIGDPGASHAFDIAGRVGLDRELLDQARALVGEERHQLEALLQDLAQRARHLALQEQRYGKLVEEAERGRAADAKRRRDLESRMRDERAELRRRGEELVRTARRQLEDAVREVRRAGAESATVKRARRQLQQVQKQFPAPDPLPDPPDLARGDRVGVPHLGLRGQVVEIRGEKVGVLADGMRVSVDRQAVVKLAETEPDDGRNAPATGLGAVSWTWDQDDPGIPPELDLRGMRLEEAWNLLDKLLDRAVPVGLSELTVVHGMGAGKLRERLLEKLDADPRVATFHPGGERRNNFGATVVHLL
jgi:DNA mismatch repair protein MutS2